MGGEGGRQVKKMEPEEDSQMIQLVDSMENTVGRDLIESFYGIIMTVDIWIMEGGMVIQAG